MEKIDNKLKIIESLKWAKALKEAMEFSLSSADPNYIWKYGSYKDFARKYNQIVEFILEFSVLPPLIELYDLAKMPSSGNLTHPMQKAYFDNVFVNISMLCAILETQSDYRDTEIGALKDFFKSKLRVAVFNMPDKEKEVQDVIEQLLIGKGMQKGQDYDREVGRVKFSSKEVIPDFIMTKLSLAIEVKLIKTIYKVKEVIDEINADIIAYSKQYRQLLFIVYDLGYIRDEIEFRHDIEEAGNIDVVVIKN